MNTHDPIDLLAHITDETLRSVCSEKIVLPSDYATVFAQKIEAYPRAKGFDDNTMVDVLAQRTLEQARSLMSSADAHLNTLSECATQAHKAIMIEDKDKIGDVLSTVIQLRKEIDQLRQEVYKDALTKVYNRKWIYDHLLNADHGFEQEGILGFIDVNDFKHINDTYGHHIGDRVLFHIASTLKSELALQLPSNSGKVLRYAGDEFMVIALKDTFELKAFLEGVQKKISATRYKAEDKIFTMSFSFGIASFMKDDDFNERLQEADTKMYENKALIKKG